MSTGEAFDPSYIPTDPVAEALDMFARMPIIIGREPDSEMAAVYEGMAAMMAREGLLDGLDWNDARGAIAAMAYDLMERGTDHLLIRAGWMAPRYTTAVRCTSRCGWPRRSSECTTCSYRCPRHDRDDPSR